MRRGGQAVPAQVGGGAEGPEPATGSPPRGQTLDPPSRNPFAFLTIINVIRSSEFGGWDEWRSELKEQERIIVFMDGAAGRKEQRRAADPFFRAVAAYLGLPILEDVGGSWSAVDAEHQREASPATRGRGFPAALVAKGL